MATFTAANAENGFPVYGESGAGDTKTATGTITVSANPVAADVYEMCRIPAGATIVGGAYFTDDLDSADAIDLDLGWAANGTEAADTDGLGNFGAISLSKYDVDFGGGDLPTFTAETVIQVYCNVTATTFVSGNMSVVINYVMD